MWRLLLMITISWSCVSVNGQRIVGLTKSTNFVRNMTDVPSAAASLAFVFDITGSMWEDLNQVIAGARKILATTLDREEVPLYDFVLVPFHDPNVGPITVTTDPKNFQRQLRQLYVRGGGDCPEMSITAISEALQISLPGSFIYVFTDARSKDFNKLHEVLKIIQRKQSQVIFVLTGDCGDKSSAGYKAYEKIAATSSGQVFVIDRSDVSEVVKFIEVSVQAHKVVLLATDHSEGGTHTWNIPFDPELREVTLSVSGRGRRLRIYDPDNRLITESRGLETLLELEQVLIVNLKSPQPGIWRVVATSGGEHSLRVTGLSKLDFHTRFSKKPTLDWIDTDYQPVEGVMTHVLLNATGLAPPGLFHKIRILNISGEIVKDIELEPPPDPDQPTMYAVPSFITPSFDFYISVLGVTHEEFPFVRATKNAILNIEAVAPTVFMQPTHPGYFDYPAEIPCHVKSLLPYRVEWGRQVDGTWISVGASTSHEEDATIYLRIDEVTEDSEGIYRCVAFNAKGVGTAQTHFDVEERPPFVSVPYNVTVPPGEDAILTCDVVSKKKYTVRWRKANGDIDFLRGRVMRNNSLLIRETEEGDEGGYVCEATNEGGTSTGTVFLILMEKPTVKVTPSEPQKFVAGDKLWMRCRATGFPEPVITWLKGNEIVTQEGRNRLQRNGTVLKIIRAEQSDEGSYTCSATNKAGTAVGFARMIYIEMPTVNIVEDDVLILEGLEATLVCQVTGVPRPRIVWLRDGVQIAYGARYGIAGDSSLRINEIRAGDDGNYSCVAKNEVGQAMDYVIVRVGRVPVLTRAPSDVGIDIGEDGYMPCAAEGYPYPELSWTFTRDNLNQKTIRFDGIRVFHDTESDNVNIFEVSLEDEGVYTCTATNQYGSDFKSGRLTVTGLVPPRIFVENLHPHVIEGETVTLTCPITDGNPTPTRVWLRQGVEFEPSGRVQLTSRGEIIITDARPSDVGVYICSASNVAGTNDVNIDLEVWVAPTITNFNDEYRVIEGNPISMICQASGIPDPNIEWEKEGVSLNLRQSSHFSVLDSGKLVIYKASTKHTGHYTCIAENPAGSDTRKTFLKVYYKPRTSSDAIDHYTVVKENSITMKCPVTDSDPPPTFKWVKDGHTVQEERGVYEILLDGSLKIFSTELSDDGNYTCIATNEAGSVTHDMSLIVYVPPIIFPGPSVVRGMDGEDMLLHCDASGIPLPKISWQFADVEISTQGRFQVTSEENTGQSELHFKPARLVDDGTYRCFAENIAGSDSRNTEVDVQIRPSIENNNQDLYTPSTGDTLAIPCAAFGDPKPIIRWYRAGEELTGLENDVDILQNGTLVLLDLDQDDTAEYTCEAENEHGVTKINSKVVVYESPKILNRGTVTEIWVEEGKSTTLECIANAVPKPSISWFRVGSYDTRLELEPNRVEIERQGELLQFRAAILSDTGRYRCLATNEEGETFKLYDLGVYRIPTIEGDDLVELEVIQGHDLELDCVADGVPPPVITWYKGSNEILEFNDRVSVDNRGQRLTIRNIDLPDQSEYTCFAGNRFGDDEKMFSTTVLVPPSIEGEGEHHDILINSEFALTCVVEGIPRPIVHWYKDNVPVSISSHPGILLVNRGMRIEFPAIQLEHEGSYKCVAKNKAGTATKVDLINVQVPPSLPIYDDDGGPDDIDVIKGDNATIYCEATGDPPPVITWYKDGALVTSGYLISNDGTSLQIINAKESDAGEFMCSAENDVGVVTQTTNVNVLVPPEILGDDQTFTIKKGDTIKLECRATGNPQPEITWYQFDIPISEDDTFSMSAGGQYMVVQNAQERDAAEYKCVASNSVGIDTKHTRLYINVPPTIHDFDEESYSVIEGDKLRLYCVADGIPPPEYSWLKDGQVIQRSENFKFQENKQVLVLLKSTVQTHEGTYTCVASNEAGYNEKDTTVTVLIPPSIDGEGKTISSTVIENKQIDLNCRVIKGKPTPVVRWYTGQGELISRGSTLWKSSLTDQRLSNIYAQLGNTGHHWCEATNIAGSSKKDFEVDVQVPPVIIGDSNVDKTVVLGQTTVFECKVTGVPKPFVIWLKDGNVWSTLGNAEEAEEKPGFHTLTVNEAQKDDQGTYTCIASNDAGEASKDVNLDVYLPPSFNDTGITEITILEGENTDLFCEVNAFPRPKIWWYKDGRPVYLAPDTVDDRVLQVIDAKLSDTGLYKCRAENVAGDIDKLFKLKVHSYPTIQGPANTELTKLVGDQFDMECNANGVPNPTITWTKGGIPITAESVGYKLLSKNRILRVQSANLLDTAAFTCHAINVEGSDSKNYDVTVHEPPSITGPERNHVNVNLGDGFVLDCEVTGTPIPAINWYKHGIKLQEGANVEISDDGMHLTIYNSKLSDDAEYICNATNVQAYDTKQFDVDVRVPPSIDPTAENIWVPEGQNVNLTCNVRSNSAVTIKWLKNGAPLKTSPVARPILNGRRLMLFNMMKKDAASYTCVASNAAGESEETTNVDVYSAPIITNADETEVHNVVETESITLECIAKGYPTPKIQWLKNFIPIEFDESGKAADERFTTQRNGRYLSIGDAQVFDEGEYMCRAENEAGVDNKNYVLNVFVPPMINRALLQDIVKREKSYIRVQCIASGFPIPEVNWLKDGEDFLENDALKANGNYIDQKNYLMFLSVLEKDAGRYSCVAKNVAGEDEAGITITVNVPPQLEGEDEYIEVVRDTTMEIRCSIARGIPEPNMEWWKRSSKLRNSNRVSILDNGHMLRITPVQTDDYGTFTCVAKNSEGSDRRRTTVRILEPPEFDDTNEPEEIDVILGFSRYLTCDIHAEPPPVLEWLKDGESIFSDADRTVDRNGHILYIHSARKEDDGFYTCRATNKAGSDDKTTKLNVLIPPTIENDGNDNNLDVNQGDSTELNCKVGGYPEPTIEWFKNGQPIDSLDIDLVLSDNDQVLGLRNAEVSDAARYNCVVKNKAGSDSKFFRVNVRVPPTIAGPPVTDLVMIQGRSYELDCYSYGNPKPENSWTKDSQSAEQQYTVLGSNQRLQVYRATEFDKGQFKCTATNVAGQAEKVFNVVVHLTPEFDDPSKFIDISVNKGDNILLDCSSSTFPTPSVQWRKNGEILAHGDFGEFGDERISLEANEFILRIRDANKEDATQYSCDIENDAGENSRQFFVDVNTPPEIFGDDYEKIVKTLDSSFSLHCPVQGTPTPEIMWLKHGDPVEFNEDMYEDPSTSTLRIENAKVSDAGSYTCVATNIAGEATKNFDVDIQVQPSILDVGPDNLDVILGNGFVLRCPVEGNPTPSITWYKDGELLMPSNTGVYTFVSETGEELSIDRTEFSDEARYTCEAINAVGRDDKSFNVNILIPPAVGLRATPNNIEVNETYTAVLDCNIQGGNPPPEITWTHNGNPLQFSKRVRSFDSGRRLEIYRSMTSDTGIYQCTATNDAGSVSDSIKLDVYVPPKFEDPSPQEIVVLKGDNVELDCTVDGVPEPSMSWLKTSADEPSEILLSGETVFSQDYEHVYLDAVDVDDTAVYACIASSISGTAQKGFNVTVMVPPNILTPNQLTEIKVVEGEEFNLYCPVEGVPFPQVSWLKQGKPLPQLDLERVKDNGQQFYVAASQLTDIGSYSCIAKSPAGEDSREFDVDVYIPPSDDKDNNITAVVGSDVLLECTSTAVPPPTFQWFKSGEKIPHTSKLLLLKNVQSEDEGKYTCEATNDAGTSHQNTNLSVFEKPTILPTADHYVAELHDNIELFCFANGIPRPTVTWWKDNVQIDESTPNYVPVDDALLVQRAQLEDAGKFMCLASNTAGSARKEIRLDVYEKPYIEQGDVNITVYANEPVILPCEVKGSPKPTVSWTKQGEGLFSVEDRTGYRKTEHGSIEISAASVSDTGLYRCIGQNEAGDVFKDIQLTVIVSPSIVKGQERYIVEPGSTLEIPCEAYGTPAPTISWFKESIENELLFGVDVFGPNNVLTLSPVELEDEGTYTCMAVNEAGYISYSPQVLVRKAPSVTIPEPVVTELVGKTVKLPCEVEGTPSPIVKWRKGPNEIDFDNIRYTQMFDNALRISVLELTDAASYTCVAQNSAGTAFGKVKLVVQIPPDIFSNLPEEVIAIAGQPFTFPVETLGFPTPKATWYHNENIILPQGISSHYIVQDGGSLQIPIVSASDEGMYRLNVENPAGEAGLAVYMRVHLPPVITPVSGTNISVIQGEQIPLDISVEGEPVPEVTWTKDGIPLDENDRRIQFMTFGSVFINNATSTDAGEYVATAINAAGRDSVVFQVTVYSPPIFVKTPEDQSLETGDLLELFCSASGLPIPKIVWKFNGQPAPSLTTTSDYPGSSRIVIKNLRKEDRGTYTCQAINIAGSKVASAFVTVGAPPVFTNEHEPIVTVTRGDTAWIDCEVKAIPAAVVRWTMDGQSILMDGRYQQFANGTLVIFDTKEGDQADYKCIATNDAGSVDRTTKLVLQSAPVIVLYPEDTTVLAGEVVILQCVAEGVPEPTIGWTKNGEDLPNDGRFTQLLDNSLQIAAAQLGDTAEYECLASNFLGSKLSTAQVTVQVNGGYSSWNDWAACSVSCGDGVQMRVRFCNSPPPSNGGLNCQDPSEETRACTQLACAVNGGWGEYGAWEQCSVRCGKGTQTRYRNCNNPPPSNGGLSCQGNEFQQRVCTEEKCAVSGGWSDWSAWDECSVTCGNGVQSQTRTCTNPPPSPGSAPCKGKNVQTRICSPQPCPIVGNWASWASWSFCSVSCGGGSRTRVRFCNNPPPQFGGEICSGSHIQSDNCNPEPCSVDGNWAEWGHWGTCSKTCGSGMRSRYRHCSNPTPKHGGKFCPGKSSEMLRCSSQPDCPEDGQWAGWSDWSLCSVTCGEGTQSRERSCSNPPPKNNGLWCQGDATQTTKCSSTSCHLRPTIGKGVAFGNVNGLPFGKSDILAHALDIGDNKTRINAVIKNMPSELGPLLQNQVSILTPIFWTLAREVGGAYNGYTLTNAEFTRQVMVEFITGEVVRMDHYATGIDPIDGAVVMEVELTGEVPTYPPINLEIMDYTEDYVQTGPGSLYAYSDRFFSVDNILMLYSWNHSIQYDLARGRMPFLVETLDASNIRTEYDEREQELNLQLDVSIGKGYPSDECPPGFLLDVSGLYCQDEDECASEEYCSHDCSNSVGSFRCSCPEGLRLGDDAMTCKDIDECASNKVQCEAPTQCVNNQGSYRCEVVCADGYTQSEDGSTCSDIDECESRLERVCEHICFNIPGSYMCQCRDGFKQVEMSKCEDINECEEGACQGNRGQCKNTQGSYYCTNECGNGYRMERGNCEDINECNDPDLNICDQGCENVKGSYRCLCLPGFIRNSLEQKCEDVNECEVSAQTCQYRCTNTIGSFNCYCPPGYRVSSNGRTCDDINECIEGEPKCLSADEMCANTFGEYKCVNSRCPEQYIRRNGVCVRECLSGDCPQKYKHFFRFNSTFVRVGLGKGEPLLTLYVSYVNSHGELELHRNTRFSLKTPSTRPSSNLFGVKTENEERGVVYVKQKLLRQHVRWYVLRVAATSSRTDGDLEYETIFNLHINVAPNPFEN